MSDDGVHTIGRWLTERATRSPLRIAIDDRGATTDYATLGRRASALADGLRRAGYGPGDRIATVSGNSTDHIVAFFACALVGVAFVPLSWRLTAHELADLIRRSTAAVILCDDENATLLAESLRTVDEAPEVATLGPSGVEAHVPPARTRRVARPVRDDDPLLVIFTSGSEASPKGAVLTHANCFWNNLALAQALPLTEDDVVLAVLPQFHVAAWNVQPLLAWWVGATVVLEGSFHPSRVLQLIGERGVTCMMAVPIHYGLLAAAREWDRADISSLRLALVGGATVPQVVRDAWSARGVPLTQGYGLTEAGPNVLHQPAAEPESDSASVGRPYPHVEVRLVDPETGLELEGPTVGELWVRGPSVFVGYLGDEAATRRALHGEWLRTGDLAARDHDGRYRIVDRLKDIYISGGENVAPAEVEHVLLGHPLIAEAAVVGAPDPVWGERGVAFVVRRVGAILSEDEVLAHARTSLAGFKVPVRVVMVDSLPLSSTDKVARSRLRDWAATLMEEVARDRQ